MQIEIHRRQEILRSEIKHNRKDYQLGTTNDTAELSPINSKKNSRYVIQSDSFL